ncbi:MAG: hypothetical protein AAF211_05240 [Myxococcota bacterium]
MNCEDVRQRLLEIDLDHLDELAPHLDRCPDCAALVDAIRAAEADLDQRLEDFVTTASLDHQWTTALREVDGRAPRASWLSAGVLALAAAAVVALALWSSPPPPDHHAATPPPLMDDLRDRQQAFDAVDLSPNLGDMPREEQDVLLRSRLQEKSDAYVALETTAEELVSDETVAARWRVEALIALAKLYADMGDAIADSTPPTYLAANQHEYYVARLRDRAVVQWTKAIDTYLSAADLAAASGVRGAGKQARRAAEDVRGRLTAEDQPEP